MRRLSRMLRDDQGATSIEYGLICALVFLAMIGGVSNFGMGLSNMLTNVATRSSAKL